MEKPWEHPECLKQTVFRHEVWSVLLEQNWFFKKRVFIYQSQTPSLSRFLPVPLATISHVYESACVVYIDSFVPHVSDTCGICLSQKKKKRQKKCMFLLSVQRQMSRIVGNKQTNKNWRRMCPLKWGERGIFLARDWELKIWEHGYEWEKYVHHI